MGSSKCPAEKCQITRTKQRGGDRNMYNLNQLKDLASRENAVSSAHDQTYTVGKQDAKCGHLGTTFAVFICLSSKAFAGW